MVTPMSSPSSGGAERPAGSTSPGWLDELAAVLDARRRLVVASAIGLSLLGMLAAYLLPQFVPPRPVVGAAVGLAAVLLAVAIGVATDSADLTVRGARHVRAAGGQVAAVLAGEPTPSAAADLAARIDARAATGGRHWVAVAPASRSFGSVSPWADALGVALADAGRRVVVIDLADGPTPGRPGVVEVVNDELKLGQAVVFDPERMLARLRPGADDVRALELVTGLVPRLPSDIEILVLALPALGQPGALAAAGLLDRVLVVAETDATPRVDLIASLDAVDATDTAAEVVLVEPYTPNPLDRIAADVPPASGPAEPAGPEAIRAADDDMLRSAAPIPDAEPQREPAPRPVPAAAPERSPFAREADPQSSIDDAAAATDTERPAADAGEPTVRFDPRELAEADDAGAHLREHGRWAAPAAHRSFTGAKLDEPTPEPRYEVDHAPLVPDEPDDDVRVTAALQTLAQEVWHRDPDDD